jgi:hypothetical protein
LAGLRSAQAAHEAIDLAGRVNNALLASVKRVAVGTNFHTQVRAGRTNHVMRAASDADNAISVVLGVNTLLHSRFS